mmetsp:Transcript_8103/g.12396  ORF Transcript_8103/g.12396 Transcript_8103/m.12396 type:complete len:267 (+) Transcript_8103:397-1197(+)
MNLKAGPISLLSQSFKRRRGCVYSVVPLVWCIFQAETLPLSQNYFSNRPLGSCCWVGRAQYLATEISPVESFGIPLDNIIVDGCTVASELASHAHKKCIENIQWFFAFYFYQTTVKATPKFYNLIVWFAFPPGRFETVGVHPKPLAGLHGITGTIRSQYICPRFSKEFLKFIRRYGQIFGFQQRRLGGNSVVVLINEFLVVNFRTSNVTLLSDGDRGSAEHCTDFVLNFRKVCMGLYKNKSPILGSRTITRCHCPFENLEKDEWFQ